MPCDSAGYRCCWYCKMPRTPPTPAAVRAPYSHPLTGGPQSPVGSLTRGASQAEQKQHTVKLHPASIEDGRGTAILLCRCCCRGCLRGNSAARLRAVPGGTGWRVIPIAAWGATTGQRDVLNRAPRAAQRPEQACAAALQKSHMCINLAEAGAHLEFLNVAVRGGHAGSQEAGSNYERGGREGGNVRTGVIQLEIAIFVARGLGRPSGRHGRLTSLYNPNNGR